MRNNLLLTAALLLLSMIGFSQTLFTDDFEAGSTNWAFTGTASTWGLSTLHANSATHSLSESPTGNYGNNKNIYATMVNGVDLSTALSADLTFFATYTIETDFDTMYVEVSTNNFTTYTRIAYFSQEYTPLPAFTQYTYSLAGFCGNNNVKVRFHFKSDGAYVVDGMYIDDVVITASSVDNAAPLIIHNARNFYEGRLNDDTLYAEVIDISGISSTTLTYTVDLGAPQTVTGTLVSGSTYKYIIPTQAPGAWIEYSITGVDASANNNSITTSTFVEVAGNHIISDNGVVDYFGQFGPGAPAGSPMGAAVRVALGSTDIAALLIRNYFDVDHTNDPMEIHIWNDNGGLPGTDVITPFTVNAVNAPMTYVDLRTYSAQLSGLTGTYYIGFIVPTGIVNLTMTQPGVFNRSYNFINGAWEVAAGTGGNDDYHFRAVTSLNLDVEGPAIVNDSISADYHSVLAAHQITAHISDMSGVASASLTYWVDGGAPSTISALNVNGNVYAFSIPAQTPGAWVKYILSATDLNTIPYTSETDTFRYIAGNYFKFDLNNPNVYVPVTFSGSGYPSVSEMVDFGSNFRNVVAILIKNYYSTSTPANTPNNDMEVHLWGDDGAGLPGVDLISPFTVASEAGANSPMAFTRVDLRNVTGASGVTGKVFAGFIVPTGSCAVLADTATILNHSYYFDGNTSSWTQDLTNNFHIRIITSDLVTNVPSISGNSNLSLYPNPSDGNFFIDFNSNDSKDVSVVVYDVTGKVVYSINSVMKGVQSVDLSRMSKGIYYLKVQSGNEVYNHKVVLQ